MGNRRQQRGEPNRELDPLLARAISRLIEHMQEHGITQTAVADASGVSQSQISRILDRERPEVSFYVFARIAHGAGLTLDGLVAELPRRVVLGQIEQTPVPSSSVHPSRTR